MKFIYIVLFAAFSASCSKEPTQPTGDVAKIVAQIDAESTNKLGIGLRELEELAKASDIALTSESTMKAETLSKLKTLESAGYVTIAFQEEPTVAGNGIKFYKVQKTAKGRALAKALARL